MFAYFVPCVNLGKKKHQMEICLYKDKSRMELEVIKNCIFNDNEKIVKFKIYVKDLEIELLLSD